MLDKSTIKSLRTLLESMEEASAILAKKAKLEQEVTVLEGRVAKAQAAVEAAQESLATICSKVAGEEARFEHEKRRHASALTDCQVKASQDFRELTAKHAEEQRQAIADHKAVVAQIDHEKLEVENSIAGLRAEDARLRKSLADFKQRISLP